MRLIFLTIAKAHFCSGQSLLFAMKLPYQIRISFFSIATILSPKVSAALSSKNEFPVIVIFIPPPSPAIFRNGMTASGPASPIKAVVGRLTTPPLASRGIVGKLGTDIPSALAPTDVNEFIDEITLFIFEVIQFILSVTIDFKIGR